METSTNTSLERRVPPKVYAFALCVAALGLSIFVILFGGVKAAFAAYEPWPGGTFTYNGTVYPSSLAGTMVTFVQNPSAPDAYIGKTTDVPIIWRSGTWYDINAKSIYDWSYNEELSGSMTPFWCSESSGVTNPWYVAWNTVGNSSVGTGAQYYNGTARSWYRHNPNYPTRTVILGYNMTTGSTSSDVPKLLLHHDFIRYVVDNSDFRTRYGLPTNDPTLDIQTSFGTSSITVSWTGNPDIWVQRREGTDTWVNVQYVPAPSPYTYQITSSGYYRVFGSQTGYQSYTSGGRQFTIAGLDFVSGSVSMASDFSSITVTATFNDPQPRYVTVQVREDNPASEDYGVWRSLLPALTYSNGVWSGSFSWSEADRYTSVRVHAEDLSTSADFFIGVTETLIPGTTPDMDGSVFGSLLGYVTDFFNFMGQFFAWLPAELRTFLVLAITAMVILGVVQLVKP